MLELINISKKYGKKEVLSHINLKLDKGIYGLLGPNGAGKSTMMNIITDIINPTMGEVLYNGKNIKELKDKYRLHIGYLPQKIGFYNNFTGRKTLEYFAVLRGVDKKVYPERIEKLLEKVNLIDVGDNKVKTYSGGMKQRLGIAIALIGEPDMVIFDEPTVGLNPKERVKFRNMISELAKNKIIILSTHIVSDVKNLADYIIFIKKGNIIECGKRQEILEKAKIVIQDKEELMLEDVYMNYYGEE